MAVIKVIKVNYIFAQFYQKSVMLLVDMIPGFWRAAFTRLSGRYSVLKRPLSEMKRSFIPRSSFKSMARAKAGINAPLT